MKNFKKVLSLTLALLMVIGSVVVAPVDAKAAGTYTKVTDVSTITSSGTKGKEFVIIAAKDGKYYAMDSYSKNWITAAEVEIDSTGAITSTNVPVITVTSTDDGVQLKTAGGDSIYSANDNKLYNSATNHFANFAVSESGTDLFKFKCAGTTDERNVAFNGAVSNGVANNKFRQYKATTTDSNADYVTEFMVYEYTDNTTAAKTDYYLIGFINGADYGCEKDLENLGEYKFVDGKLTAKFTQDSYVFVKTGDNQKCLMCSEYVDGNKATFATGNKQKMKVPGNVKYEFTLVENADGSVTVSYAEVVNTTPTTPTTPEEIVNAAYAAMNNNTTLEGTYTLEGTIVSIDTAYAESYKNITVTMTVEGMDTKPIQCFRLTVADKDSAEEVAKLAGLEVGNKITVEGSFGYYNGKVQYNAGSILKSVKSGSIENTLPETATAEEIVNAAYAAMNNNTTMIGTYSLKGVIASIDTPYDETYGNITVTMVVDGMNDKPIQCFRLKGDGAAELQVGDTITVEGTFGYFNGKVQYNAGCTLKAAVDGNLENTLPGTATATEIIDAAYAAMNNNTTMIGEYKLKGVITSIDTEYSEQYGNITVTMVVDGMNDKPIQCFRLKGEGIDKLKVGDTITVNGSFGYYNGKVQYNAGSMLVSYVSDPIKNTGDNFLPIALVLFAGCALVAVGVVSKKKFA